MATIQGWGRQTWNSGAWNTFAPVTATGNGLTSTVGSVSTVTTNIFGVTGNQLTSSIGDAAQANEYAATGNAVTSSLGTMPSRCQPPTRLQRVRRKYSWRGKLRNDLESVSIPTKRESRPVLASALICHSIPSC